MTTHPLTLSVTASRRAILGRQGLWPGRRWSGSQSVAAALETIEAVQLDPLVAVARSHDIALQGRILDYQPEWLYDAVYGERCGFDYGTLLCIYPMAELPHWHATHMASRRAGPGRQQFSAENGAVLEQVRTILREEGAVTNRQLTGNARVNSYRGRKDTALALFHLWLAGEVMITGRNGFDRIYDLAERVASADLRHPTPDPTVAERHFARKAAAFHGIAREGEWLASMRYFLDRPIGRKEGRAWIDRLIAQELLLPVTVEGWKDRGLAVAEDRPMLETIAAGGIPAAWEPAGPTTQDEVTLLAPLEIVSARGRAGRLFDFDYIWEVYKPADQRRWGYYVLPVLYGDRLVARIDLKLERRTMALHIPGFWLEPWQSADDPAFAQAFGRGMARFGRFLHARTLVPPADLPAPLRQALP